MRSFFQNLDSQGVRYLLISGQASVLYGAATFSEDIDLWIAPTSSNIRELVLALQKSRATVYKLTPPLELRYFRRGHGFHFRLPEDQFTSTYLDIMGRPPRVGSFSEAAHRASWISSDWGRIPVVSIPDLVELKKTRRLSDYDVISSLMKLRLVSHKSRWTQKLILWAFQNCFRIEDAEWLVDACRDRGLKLPQTRSRWLLEFIRRREKTGWSSARYEQIQTLIGAKIAKYQRRDIDYWSGIIQELKELRRKNMLLSEGLPVAPQSV